MTFFESVWQVLVQLAPWLLLGAGVAALLHVALPPGFVRRALGGRGGVARAVLLGVPLPLCSCGVIPAGLSLRKQGATKGASVGFLIATPQTGVDSVLVSASFLGWPFALFKLLSAGVLGLLGGWLTDRASSDDSTRNEGPDDVGGRKTLRDGVDHFVELLETIWRWLVFGILASAALTTFVPPGALAGFAAYGGALAMGAALALSVPLYVCATASVPIAAALVAAGLPTGAALVFLMAGPATNVATIGAVHRAFGGRVLAIYLGTIIGGSVGLGLGFDALLGTTLTASTAGAMHDHSGASFIESASAMVLVALLGWFALRDLASWFRRAAKPEASALSQVELEVRGMTCGGCARKLTSALESEEGVDRADVTHDPGRAVVFGAVDEATVRRIVEATGYRALP